MKTLTYLLIPIIILSIIASSFARKAETKHTLLLQSSERTISSVSLTKSAEVLSRRLKDFSTEKFEVSILEKSQQIKVIMYGEWDMPAVKMLAVHKGVVEFYETYNQADLTALLNGDNRLFSLLTKDIPGGSGAKIGCTQDTGVARVNKYLETLDLGQNCKFAWTQDFNKTRICLYALKISNSKGPVINYNDIESVKYDEDIIKIKLKSDASGKFAEATRRNLNNDIAIVLDGNVISAPNVRSEIDSGEIEISGKFTKTEAGYVASMLNGGVMPGSFIIVRAD